jgi:hypothetical protein
MFYGQASQAGTWFNALGYTLPYGTSVADFILDLASGDVAAGDRLAPLHVQGQAPHSMRP